MDTYRLYKQCVEAIDDFINDVAKGKLTQDYPTLFYTRFLNENNNKVRHEIMDIVDNVNVSCINNTLEVIWQNNNSMNLKVLQCYRGITIPINTVVSNLSSLKVCITNEIERHQNEIVEMDKTFFLKDLIVCSKLMQGNAIYYGDLKENFRNDYVRDLLEFKGYIAKDQTRQSLSKNGCDAGEIDLLIKANTKIQNQIIIEGLNLESCDRDYIKDHFDRLFKYDRNGNDYNVMLVYVTAVKFEEHCLKYKHYIEEEYDGDNKIIDSNVEKIDDSPEIFVLKTSHKRGSKLTLVYHLLVHLYDEKIKKK